MWVCLLLFKEFIDSKKVCSSNMNDSGIKTNITLATCCWNYFFSPCLSDPLEPNPFCESNKIFWHQVSFEGLLQDMFGNNACLSPVLDSPHQTHRLRLQHFWKCCLFGLWNSSPWKLLGYKKRHKISTLKVHKNCTRSFSKVYVKVATSSVYPF